MVFDVAIVGGGITGCSALYVLSKYTNVKNVALFEKHSDIAQGVSNKQNNSQTLHFGDIETNYTVEKAEKVKEAADMVVEYIHDHEDENLYSKDHKMVLAVGEEEVERLKERYENFKDLFPKLRMVGREGLSEIEPKVVEERDPETELLALVTEDGYRMNYGKLAKSFVNHGKEVNGKEIDTFLEEKVKDIRREGDKFVIKSGDEEVKARAVLVATGGYSLEFAYNMGYGKEFIILPVAGSFFTAESMVNGKVYMMQDPKLPFAAIHADPDVDNPRETRFGPVSKVLPMLETGKLGSIKDFLDLFEFRWSAFASIFKILSDQTYLRYVVMQVLYSIPLFGKWLYLREARKIVPSIKYTDLTVRNDLGGIRPQVVDTDKRQMQMGEAKIVKDKIIFDITPSPGASVCLKNAEKNVKKIINDLGSNFRFYYSQFNKDFKE